MTVHVLLVDPPRPGSALPGLVESDILDDDAATTLAQAMIRDIAVAAAESGGDLLINYPTESQLPDRGRTGKDPETELRDLLDGLLDEDVRYEIQVGDSFAARAGNAVVHLLDEERVDSVAVLDGRTPTLGRTALDSAAMKLRRSEVVVGPAPGSRVAYLGLTEPIDFDGAWAPPALRTVVDRSLEAGLTVDFLPLQSRVDDSAGLATLVSLVRARRAAGRLVPEHTAAAIESLGLEVDVEHGRRRIVSGSTNRA